MEHLIPVKSLSQTEFTHISLTIDYYKGQGICLHIIPARPVDHGCQYGICEFDHVFRIHIQDASRLTPTVKARIAELDAKVDAWQSHLAHAYDNLHQDADFSSVISLWVSDSPATPPADPSSCEQQLGKWFMFFFDFDN